MAQNTEGYTKNQALNKYGLFLSDLKVLPRTKVFLNGKHFYYVYNPKDLEQSVYRNSVMTEEETKARDDEQNKRTKQRLLKLKLEIKKEKNKLRLLKFLRKRKGLN
jgi:hypothetical protein